MKKQTIPHISGMLLLACATLLTGSALVSCSSDEFPEQTPVEDFSFTITARGTQGAGGSSAKAADFDDEDSDNEAASPLALLVHGEEDINPEGWNDPQAESLTAKMTDFATRMKTLYRYDGNNNYLSVTWKAGDKIGIKTVANAANNTKEWTMLTLDAGAGNTVATFEGLAYSRNDLLPEGSQNIVAVYPYSADGSYDFNVQPGTIAGLGDFDVRADNGELNNANVADLYFKTKISVLRIAKEFFDLGEDTKTKGKSELTVTVSGAGLGNHLADVCSDDETATAGSITATVTVDATSGKPLEDVFLAFVPIDTDVSLFNVEIQSGNDVNTYSMYNFHKSHFETGKMYNLKHPGTDVSEQCIDFKDAVAEAICLQNFDTDDNGCISYREARSVTYLGTAFRGSDMRYFPELQYFNALTMISANAFNGCTKLEEIGIHDGIKIISNSAFFSCTSLATLPSLANVTEIGADAFQGCTSLANIPSLANVTTIGNQAFYDCTSLATLPSLANVTTIGDRAFENCKSLDNLPELTACTTIGERAFFGCQSLTSVSAPLLTEIPAYAFWYCFNLSNVSGPNVKRISYYAFCNLFNMSNPTRLYPTLNFPVLEELATEAIGFNSYFGDYSGTLILPSTLKRVQYDTGEVLSAFMTENLSIYCYATTPPTVIDGDGNINTKNDANYVGDVPFIPSSCTLYVPAASVNAYKTALWWRTIASQIQAIP
ncbi:MAG: leucine-rich repeat domain-containing protein [Bacteroidaceae bacterium]|nr:leucine-rich repeat domain-containing protein [Bacteroidaceae bacterium]